MAYNKRTLTYCPVVYSMWEKLYVGGTTQDIDATIPPAKGGGSVYLHATKSAVVKCIVETKHHKQSWPTPDHTKLSTFQQQVIRNLVGASPIASLNVWYAVPNWFDGDSNLHETYDDVPMWYAWFKEAEKSGKRDPFSMLKFYVHPANNYAGDLLRAYMKAVPNVKYATPLLHFDADEYAAFVKWTTNRWTPRPQ